MRTGGGAAARPGEEEGRAPLRGRERMLRLAPGQGPAQRLRQRTGRALLWMQAQHRERALARFQTRRLVRRPGMGLLQGPAQGLLRALGQGRFWGQGIPQPPGE
jgi:hypothetical protein